MHKHGSAFQSNQGTQTRAMPKFTGPNKVPRVLLQQVLTTDLKQQVESYILGQKLGYFR